MQENIQNSFDTDQKDIDYLKTIRKKKQNTKRFLLACLVSLRSLSLGWGFILKEARQALRI